VRLRVRELELTRLPEALDGLRIAHLSDFHLGAPLSRGSRASEKAVAWVMERGTDLVCVTGDILSAPRGEPRLRRLLSVLDRPFVVLGNHDVAVTRDPFSRAVELHELDLPAYIGVDLAGENRPGNAIAVVGVDPVSHRRYMLEIKFGGWTSPVLAGVLADEFVRPGAMTETEAVALGTRLLRDNVRDIFKV